MVKAVDIFAHHTRPSHSRPDDGAGSHQRKVVAAMQFFKQSSHGRTLDIKTAVGFGITKLPLNFRVGFKLLNLMNINGYTPVSKNQFGGLFNMPYAALTKYIQLFKAQLFGHVHIPLGGSKTFGWQIKSGKTGNRFFGYQYSARVDASLIGKSNHHLCYGVNMFVDAVSAHFCLGVCREPVDLRFG